MTFAKRTWRSSLDQMAASALSTVARQLADIIECSLCLEVFKDPRSLPCVHTFCFHCLERHHQARRKSHPEILALDCPLCRKDFEPPAGGLVNLPKNFFVEKLLRIRELSSSHGDETPCGSCSGTSEEDADTFRVAVVYCSDCRERLCSECDSVHDRLPTTRRHKRVPLRGGPSGAGTTAVSSSGLAAGFDVCLPSDFCNEHRDETLKLFCFDCVSVICVLCYVVDHSSHRCSDVETAAVDFRRKLTDDVAVMGAGVVRYMKLIDRFRADRDDFVKRTEDVRHAIDLHTAQLKEMIEKQRAELLEQLEKKAEQRTTKIDDDMKEIEQHHSTLNSLRSYTQELVVRGTAIDLSRQTNALHNTACQLLNLDATTRIPNELGGLDVAFIPNTTFDAKSNVLGKVAFNVALDTLYVSPRGPPVRAMALLCGRLYVSRCPSNSRIEVYDVTDAVGQQLDQVVVEGLTDDSLCGLAACEVNRCLYVSDFGSRRVYRLELSNRPATKDDQIMKIDRVDNFASKRNWPVESSPNGLSVCSRSRNVLVTCIGGSGSGTRSRLREFTTHGTLVREITLPNDVINPCHAIQLTAVQFLVSHGLPGDPTNRVCVVDKDGHIVRYFCGGGPKQSANECRLLLYPTDLAVDESKKFVFVCDTQNDRVLIADVALTKSRDLPLRLGSVAQDGDERGKAGEGLKQPRAICLDELRGRLYISEAGSAGRILVVDNVFRNIGEEFLCCD